MEDEVEVDELDDMAVVEEETVELVELVELVLDVDELDEVCRGILASQKIVQVVISPRSSKPRKKAVH